MSIRAVEELDARERDSVPPYRGYMSTTRVRQYIEAPPSAVYRALVDPSAVQRWMVPEDMTSTVHEFDARPGGAFRISLTYDDPTATGKTSDNTDSFGGHFVRLLPDREVVQSIMFESDDPSLRTEMTVRYLIDPSGIGSIVTGIHQNLPASVDPAQNELGWQMSLAKLAALVENSRHDDGGNDPLPDVGA